MSSPKISIREVCKIFGPDPASALPAVRGGMSKEELLAKTGHTLALKDISFDIGVGEVFVVMGLSGSGKSTLIRHLNRLIDPTAGHIDIDGRDILAMNRTELTELRRHKMSMVFQRFGLLPHKTVLDNVAYGRMVAGEERGIARKKAEEQIELVGLTGYENQYPNQLSGGMQQRVGLARALATEAEILLMDEAFSALDPLIRSDMQKQLLDLQKRLQKTIVFITHDLDEALLIGDRIAILKDGTVRQIGTPEDILLQPADDYVRQFVRDVNRARVLTAGGIAVEVPYVRYDRGTGTGLLEGGDTDAGAGGLVVVDSELHPLGLVEAAGESWSIDPDRLQSLPCVAANTRIEEVMLSLNGETSLVAVTDDNGCLCGVLSQCDVITALKRSRDDSVD